MQDTARAAGRPGQQGNATRRSSRRMRPVRWAMGLPLAMAAGAALATPPSQCARLPDDAARLACYDAVFRLGPQPAPGVMPAAAAAPAPVGASPEAPPAAALPGVPPERQPLDPAEAPPAATLFDKAWELTPAEKRGT